MRFPVVGLLFCCLAASLILILVRARATTDLEQAVSVPVSSSSLAPQASGFDSISVDMSQHGNLHPARTELAKGDIGSSLLFTARIEVFGAPFSTSHAPGQKLQLLIQAESTGVRPLLDIEEGVWAGTLPRDSYSVVGAKGSDCTYEVASEGSLSPLRPVARVEILEPNSWTLFVVDATTGENVDSVTVVNLALTKDADPQRVFYTWRDRLPPEDMGARVVASSLSSPVTLPHDTETGYYWVTANGYAPRPFERHGFHRRAKIALHRRGSLEIAIAPSTIYESSAAGRASSNELELHITSESGVDAPPLVVPVACGQVIHEEILGGKHLVEVKSSSPIGPGVILWSDSVAIRPGERTRVDIDLNRVGPATAPANLIVLAYLPKEDQHFRTEDLTAWFRTDASQSWAFTGSTPSSAWSESPDGYLLEQEFRNLALGEYLIRMEGPRIHDSIALGPGRNELVLDGSDLVHVTVHLSGRRSPDEQVKLYWGFIDEFKDTGVGESIVDVNGEARLRCPPAPIWIQAVGPNAASPVRQLDLQPGQPAIGHLELDPMLLSTVRISVWEGNSHAFVQGALWKTLRVDPIGHDGKLARMTFGSHGTSVQIGPQTRSPNWSQAVCWLSPPGRYRFTFDGTGSSDAPRTSIEIDVPAGTTDLPIELP